MEEFWILNYHPTISWEVIVVTVVYLDVRPKIYDRLYMKLRFNSFRHGMVGIWPKMLLYLLLLTPNPLLRPDHTYWFNSNIRSSPPGMFIKTARYKEIKNMDKLSTLPA